MGDSYISESTLTSQKKLNSDSNLASIRGSYQSNSVGILPVTNTSNNHYYNNESNNLKSLPTSINNLANNLSKTLNLSQGQYHLDNSSRTINDDNLYHKDFYSDNDSIKNSMTADSDVSLSIMKTEDGLPMLLALQFEYIFSK